MSQPIINFTALENAKLKQEPYPFFGIANAFNESSHENLLNDFPTIDSGGSLPLSDLPITGSMATLIDEIKSDEFRHLFEKKFNVDLIDKPIIITARGFSRQKDGKNHTDSKTKLITILLYLNNNWDSPNGRLRMLNSNDIEDYAEEFSASIGQLVAFKVTGNCWHGYHPYEGQRQSLQINYLVEEKFTSQHHYRHKISAFFKRLFK